MDEEASARAARVARRRADQDANAFSRLQAAAAASRAQAQRLLRGVGLSILDWRMLWDLHEAGPLTVRDLAQIQRTDHALISRAAADLRRRGLVAVTPGAQDRRRSLLALTEAGRAAHAAAAPIMAARRARLAAALPEPERAMLIALIDRFEAQLDPAPETAK